MESVFLNSYQELSFGVLLPVFQNCYRGTIPSSPQEYRLCTHLFSAQDSLEQVTETHKKTRSIFLDILAGIRYIWPQEMHGTLILDIYFPYINKFPWELRKNIIGGSG